MTRMQPVLKEGKETPAMEKKPYETPRILETEKLQGRATVCAKVDDMSCGAGPLQT